VFPGNISLKNSAVIKQTLEKAVSLISTKQASALVTNPINKWALKKSCHFPFEGHTDFLASIDPEKRSSVMMLTNRDGFKVIPVTGHVPIKKISANLTPELLEPTLRILNESLKFDYQIQIPKILVTGVNPHAGETATLGFEEVDVIIPVIEKLKKEGFSLEGPVAADTSFTQEKRANFDAFVCMYHDQA
jgi:Pyridoxal phosphate biosynthesis protein